MNFQNLQYMKIFENLDFSQTCWKISFSVKTWSKTLVKIVENLNFC